MTHLPQMDKEISKRSTGSLRRSLYFAFEDDTADNVMDIPSLYEGGWKDQLLIVLFLSTAHTGCLLFI